jgi:hypothetical protein
VVRALALACFASLLICDSIAATSVIKTHAMKAAKIVKVVSMARSLCLSSIVLVTNRITHRLGLPVFAAESHRRGDCHSDEHDDSEDQKWHYSSLRYAE